MRTSEWFPEFVGRHMRRHVRDDWPRPSEDPDFWAAWRHALVTHGIGPDVADEASLRLASAPPRFLADHLPALLGACRAIFAERGISAHGDPSTSALESARAASVDCPDCSGMGLASRDFDTDRGRLSFSFACDCPMGAFVFHRAREAKTPMPRLADYPGLRGVPGGRIPLAFRATNGKPIEVRRAYDGDGRAVEAPLESAPLF